MEMENIINEVMQRVQRGDDLQQVLYIVLSKYEISGKCTALQCVNSEWVDALTMFEERKRASGCSERTIEQYEFHVGRFLRYYSKPVKDITENDIYEYLRLYREMLGASNSYLNTIRYSLSSFFGWEYRKALIPKNPMEGVDPIKTEKVIRKPFSHMEIEKLRKACLTTRDRAIFEFMYSTGVRVGELVRLKISDVDIMERTAIVFGKGAKEREVYLNDIAVMYLKEYLQGRDDDSPWLFATLDRHRNQMHERGIQELFRKLGKRAGVENVHPHRTRRSFATRALSAGLRIEEVQILLGHEKIDTTLKYAIVQRSTIKFHHQQYMVA